MKIIKLSNQFENEGRDPLELGEELANYEGEQDLQNLQEKGLSHTAEILSDISSSFVERLDANFTLNGAEAWFEYKDGKVYHVRIEPSESLPDRSPPDPDDDLPL